MKMKIALSEKHDKNQHLKQKYLTHTSINIGNSEKAYFFIGQILTRGSRRITEMGKTSHI